MLWFKGSIPEAIARTKEREAVFVVFVAGDDEQSTQMAESWENEKVTETAAKGFVAIKIDSKSEACLQFSQIYPVVCIPSSFFIGDNGVPLEVIAGSMSTDELVNRIDKVKQMHTVKSDVSTDLENHTASSVSECSPASGGLVGSITQSNNGVLIEEHNETDPAPPDISNISSTTLNSLQLNPCEETACGSTTISTADQRSEDEISEKVERITKKLEERREQKQKAEEQNEIKKELERRKTGKDVLEFKRRHEEDLAKRMLEERTKEKAVWQRSKDLCLKRYTKPIFSEDSYLELYRKQKRHLNTQQLTAFRLIYAWRDRTARQEDESTGYVLPNHMMLKISEELPKEPQGIIACCNPIPPLVRQQLNELHLLILQAREMPLLKTEIQSSIKKRGPMPDPERSESLLFGPHDGSQTALDEAVIFSSTESAPLLKQGNLFSEDEKPTTDGAVPFSSLFARATISIFSDPEEGGNKLGMTVAQKKSMSIMESFENPFRMYLPQQETSAHISQAAKFDPSTKIFEISHRWKLVSQAKLQMEATAKEEARQKAQQILQQQIDARKKTEAKYQTAAEAIIPVRQQAAEENSNKKRERKASEPGAWTPKPGKKRSKGSEGLQLESEEPVPLKEFTPFDYSKSDFKAFAGGNTSKKQPHFDPNSQASTGKKFTGAKKHNPSAGNRSMSFPTGKSDRGFRHSWPKR